MDNPKCDTWRLAPVDDLPTEVKADLAMWLAETHEAFEDQPSWEHARDNLFGLVDPPMAWIGTVDAGALHATMDRVFSEKAVERYRRMLCDDPDFDFDPVMIADGRFMDGAHRVEAYVRAGRDRIPVVEVGHIVNAPVELWKRWLDGDDVGFDPGHPPEVPVAPLPRP